MLHVPSVSPPWKCHLCVLSLETPLSTSIWLRTHSLASGFSLGRKTRKYKAVMKSWAAFVRPVITGTPKRTLCNVYKGIPARRDRIIAANGGAIGQ